MTTTTVLSAREAQDAQLQKAADLARYLAGQPAPKPAAAQPQTSEVERLTKALERASARIRELEELLAQNTAKPAKRAGSSKTRAKGKGKGRNEAQGTVTHNGAVYHSMAHLAKSTGMAQSTISRQVATLGISTKRIGGVIYIEEAQSAKIGRKRPSTVKRGNSRKS